MPTQGPIYAPGFIELPLGVQSSENEFGAQPKASTACLRFYEDCTPSGSSLGLTQLPLR